MARRSAPSFGALIFGTVQMGIFYTGIDTDWFKLFLGVMVLIAVLFNELHPAQGDGGAVKPALHPGERQNPEHVALDSLSRE